MLSSLAPILSDGEETPYIFAKSSSLGRRVVDSEFETLPVEKWAEAMARRLKWLGREIWKNKRPQEVINLPLYSFSLASVRIICEAHVIAQNICCTNINFISRWSRSTKSSCFTNLDVKYDN